jgi:hypothetical protein
MEVQSQPRQIVQQDPILKNLHKNRAGGVGQDEGPEFKSQYHTHKKILTLPFTHCGILGWFLNLAELVCKMGRKAVPRSSVG